MGSLRGQILISSTGLVPFLILSYFFFDIPLALYCSKMGRSIRDFFGMVTPWGESTWYLVGSFTLFLIFTFLFRRKAYAQRAFFVFASMGIAGIIANVVKFVAGRYRPEMFFKSGLYGFEFFQIQSELTSFPSGHATTVFSLAGALSLSFGKYRVLFFSYALLIAASRIIIAAHYLSDVIVGGYIGILGVLILRKILGELSPTYALHLGTFGDQK